MAVRSYEERIEELQQRQAQLKEHAKASISRKKKKAYPKADRDRWNC